MQVDQELLQIVPLKWLDAIIRKKLQLFRLCVLLVEQCCRIIRRNALVQTSDGIVVERFQRGR